MFDELSLLWIFFDFVIIVAIPLPTEGVKFLPETGNGDKTVNCQQSSDSVHSALVLMVFYTIRSWSCSHIASFNYCVCHFTSSKECFFFGDFS